MDLHMKYLSNICRCCGLEQCKGEVLISKRSSEVTKYCSIYEYLNFSEESSKSYPIYICNKCFLNFKIQYNDYYSGKGTGIKVQIAKFEDHRKENCLVCSYRITKENTDPLYFNRNHMKILSKYCRMCKSLSVKYKSQENHKCSAAFNMFFDVANKTTLNDENIYIYPQYFCEQCCNYIASEMTSISKVKFSFVNFEKHDQNCSICKEFKYFKSEVALKTNSGSLEDTGTSEASLLNENKSIVTESRHISDEQSKIISNNINNDQSNFDIDSYTLLALKLHKQNLTHFCRLCAIPQGTRNKKRMVPKVSAHLVDCFAIFFRVNLNIEDPDIYPPYICMQCCYKLQVNLKARLKKKKAPHKLTLPYFFEKYQHRCKICHYKNYFENNTKFKDSFQSNNSVIKRKLEDNESSHESLPLKKVKLWLKLSTSRCFGLPVEQLASECKSEGVKYACRNCSVIPEKLVITSCQHLYCESCSKLLLATNNVCYDENCHNLLHIECADAGLWIQNKIAKLCFVCRNWDYCNFKGKLKEIISHELTCSIIETNLTESSMPIGSITFNNSPLVVKSELLNSLKSAVTKLCNENQQDLKASLSYLLWEQFKDEGKVEAAEHVLSLKNSEFIKWDIFSTDESLALKYMFLKTSKQYEVEYKYFLSNYDTELFKPIKEIEAATEKYLPNSVCFHILDFFGNILFKKESSKENLINTYHDACINTSDIPNIGVHWNFIDAIAKTIHELSYKFPFDVNEADNQIAFVEIKDGLQIFKEFSFIDASQNTDIFIASFCILTIYCFVKGEKKNLFKCDLPNLYKNNRTFLIAFCNDNSRVEELITTSFNHIEKNKSLLKYRLIDIKLSNGKFSHFFIKTFSSMYDDKLNRLRYGLSFSAASFCRFCDAEKDKWLSQIKDKSYFRSMFSYLESSEKSLSITDTLTYLKNSYSSNQLRSKSSYINALLCDVIFAQTIKEIIVHETANIYNSNCDCSDEEKQKLDDMVKVVDEYYHNYFGLNLQEVEKMSVGSINKFLETASTDKALELIINTTEQRLKIQKLLHLLSRVRVVYNNIKPSSTEIIYFRRNAVKLAKFLLENFKYAGSTDIMNCLHKICDHGQEALLVEPHSIGLLSSEGLQSGYLLIKKIMSVNVDAERNPNILMEVIKESWLHTSPQLHSIASAIMTHYKCTCCGLIGHSTCTCPANEKAK